MYINHVPPPPSIQDDDGADAGDERTFEVD
jgi:hypothetical protein